jgi:hypothetical protein
MTQFGITQALLPSDPHGIAPAAFFPLGRSQERTYTTITRRDGDYAL